MTVAVVVKVFDGIVIAADSATTLPLSGGAAQVYNNANKIFHLHRGLPIAAMTWGMGNIGSASIATLTKDLRRRLMGADPDFLGWEVDEDAYTIESIVDRYVEMFHGELYGTEFSGQGSDPDRALGMLIVGYSAGEKQAEAWEIFIDDADADPRVERIFDIADYGWQSFAQPEATTRLFFGADFEFLGNLKALLGEAKFNAEILPLLANVQRQPVAQAMPFADAIELAKFLAQVTAQYSHFLLGPDTVGGVVDVAGINRHEGFRWISRKHYYSPDLNPWGQAHDH